MQDLEVIMIRRTLKLASPFFASYYQNYTNTIQAARDLKLDSTVIKNNLSYPQELAARVTGKICSILSGDVDEQTLETIKRIMRENALIDPSNNKTVQCMLDRLEKNQETSSPKR